MNWLTIQATGSCTSPILKALKRSRVPGSSRRGSAFQSYGICFGCLVHDPPVEEQGQINAVVGLGNPGKQYERTRHNAGFRVLDQLAEELSFTFQERKFRASWCAGTLGDRKLVLCKPLAYMNRSGEVVAEILGYFGIDASQALVVHDDLDLPLGRLRLVRQGGPGGHRGVSSIIDHLKTRDFPRLKLGIGRPLYQEPVETFVLRAPSGEEAAVFDEMISQGVEAVRSALAFGLDVAMNRHNR